MEKKLIAACMLSREGYEKVKDRAEWNTFSEYGRAVFKEVDKYYTIDREIDKVDSDLVLTRLHKKYPKMQDVFSEYLSALPESVSLANIIKDIATLKKKGKGERIAARLMDTDPHGVEGLMEEYLSFEEIEEEDDGVLIAPNVADLVQSISGKNILPVFPRALSIALGGGIPRQSHIIIFARPDLGKTTVAINMAVGAAKMGYKVLYVDNENPPQYTVMRILTRFLNRPMVDIKAHPEKAMKAALNKNYNNIIFAPMYPGTIAKIKELCRKHKPDYVFIDQVKNLQVSKESVTENLEAVCKEARNIGKEFDAVTISLTQAGESATGKMTLRMEDAFNSKTGLQGTADLMIGLGATQEMRDRGQIMLSFPKRKFWPDLPPLLCKVNFALNKVTGI